MADLVTFLVVCQKCCFSALGTNPAESIQGFSCDIRTLLAGKKSVEQETVHYHDLKY